jgi:hypothetical protein
MSIWPHPVTSMLNPAISAQVVTENFRIVCPLK